MLFYFYEKYGLIYVRHCKACTKGWACIIDERMITLTKKLLAVLTLVMLVAVCMAIPAMAADVTYDLSADVATTIEGEWIFYEKTGNPVSGSYEIPTSGNRYWKANDSASNDYYWYEGWQTADHTVTFTVNSTIARNYDIEFVCSDKDDLSEISIYVGDTLVADTYTDIGTAVEELAGAHMKLYSVEGIPFNQGNTTVRICATKQYSTNTGRNAYNFDYIRFTPVGDELPFAVIDVEDTTIDPTCISVVFNKPITSAEGIVVNAQRGSVSKTVDGNKVKIKSVVGRTTIKVPEGFTGGTAQGTTADFEETVFAYPVQNFTGKSYAYKWTADTRIVSAYFGSENTGIYSSASSDTKVLGVIALYDGDKMVASYSKSFNLPTASSISVTLPEGEKFTEAKVFGFLEIDGELIPVGKASTRTAAQLNATFE